MKCCHKLYTGFFDNTAKSDDNAEGKSDSSRIAGQHHDQTILAIRQRSQKSLWDRQINQRPFDKLFGHGPLL